MDYSENQLTSVAAFPNITVAFPGEHWSDRRASEDIVPGEAVVPIASGGKLYMRRASGAAEAAGKFGAIALNVVQPPDNAGSSIYTEPLGPNEIVNRKIPAGAYVHAYRSGAFNLTLQTPDTYLPGDMLEWDPAGVRLPGKGGTGSWKKTSDPTNAVFEVHSVHALSTDPEQAYLKVRHFRTQM